MYGIILLITGNAYAVSKDICGFYAIDFLDVTFDHIDVNTDPVLPELDDDYFTSNADRPARGAKVQLWDNSVANPSWQSYWLSWNDPSSACVTVTVDASHTYAVRLLSDALVHGNTIKVRFDGGAPNMWYVASGPSNWDPDTGNVEIHTSTNEGWNMAAADGHAMFRRNAGVTGETILVKARDTGGQSQYNSPSFFEAPPEISISSSHIDLKYPIAHELGHFLQDAKNNYRGVEMGGAAPGDSDCELDDGSLIEREHASSAAVEGIAWYYAAVAFNQTQFSDCEVAWDGDYDANGDAEGADERTPSCEGESSEDWVEEDWFGDECVFTGDTSAPKGVQLDWMRAFWDADTDEGLDVTLIFQMFADARPDTWRAVGNLLANDPKPRLESSAVTNGIGVNWNAVDDVNGVR